MTGDGAGPTAAERGDPGRLIFPLVAEPAPRKRWQREALGGVMILGLLSVAAVVAVAQLWQLPTHGKWAGWVSAEATSDEVASRGNVAASVFQLEPGTCLRDIDGGTEVHVVPVVPCGTEHHVEVIATLRMPNGTWPGNTGVDEFAAERCVAAIYDKGVQPTSSLKWTYFGPSQSSWRLRDDRSVTCMVVSVDQPLTKSLIPSSSDGSSNKGSSKGSSSGDTGKQTSDEQNQPEGMQPLWQRR